MGFLWACEELEKEEEDNTVVSLESFYEQEEKVVDTTNTSYWEDSLLGRLEHRKDSVFFELAHRLWWEGQQLEKNALLTSYEFAENLSSSGFQELYHTHTSYRIDSSHLLLVMVMNYDEYAFEVFLLTKDTIKNKWWISDGVTQYTRLGFTENQIIFDSKTGILSLTIGDFNSDRGDHSSKAIYKVIHHSIEEVLHVAEDGFFDLDLEWSIKDSSSNPCGVGGLFMYYSDWDVVDDNTLQATYYLEVLFTHQEPYPWPDADTILLDTLSIIYSWQDSAQVFEFYEQQTLEINENDFENFQYGHLPDGLVELLLWKMRVDKGANYWMVPCVGRALREGIVVKQVY